MDRQQLQQFIDEALGAGMTPQEIDGILQQNSGKLNIPADINVRPRQVNQPTNTKLLGSSAAITQRFGNRNKIEIFSKGVNTGTDFRAAVGTPLRLPPGEWDILNTYDTARGRGRIGDRTNQGYGNMVLAGNRETGDILRFSHLRDIEVKRGDIVQGGLTIGSTGATGNVTGPHLDLEYYDNTGRLRDIMQSPYSLYL